MYARKHASWKERFSTRTRHTKYWILLVLPVLQALTAHNLLLTQEFILQVSHNSREHTLTVLYRDKKLSGHSEKSLAASLEAVIWDVICATEIPIIHIQHLKLTYRDDGVSKLTECKKIWPKSNCICPGSLLNMYIITQLQVSITYCGSSRICVGIIPHLAIWTVVCRGNALGANSRHAAWAAVTSKCRPTIDLRGNSYWCRHRRPVKLHRQKMASGGLSCAVQFALRMTLQNRHSTSLKVSRRVQII